MIHNVFVAACYLSGAFVLFNGNAAHAAILLLVGIALELRK